MSAADEAYRTAEAAIRRAAFNRAEGLDFTEPTFHALESLPPSVGSLDGLRWIGLAGTRVRDLSPLVGLTGLTSLLVAGSQVDDLAPLAALTALQAINLDNTRASNLVPLSKLRGLRSISAENTMVSDLGPLMELEGLDFLSLSGSAVSDLRPLAALTRLSHLRFASTRVKDLGPLSGLIRLQVLQLENNEVTDLSPLVGLTRLGTLIIDDTQVSNLSPLAGFRALGTLSLNGTRVRDLAPLANLKVLGTLSLDNTSISDLSPLAGVTTLAALSIRGSRVSDLSPLAGLEALAVLRFDNTPVVDLRPLRRLRMLADPDHDGPSFKAIAATVDPEIARIAQIEPAKDRADALFALLDAGWVPPEARDPTVVSGVPPRQPAPLEIEVTDTLISVAGKDGLPQQDANARAALGWEALREYRLEFASTFSVSNYAPLPAYLAAFDRAMGDEYDPARVVRIGVQAQRFVALSQDVSFTSTLPDGAASDLRNLAVEMLVFLNRFPDWVSYRDDAEVVDVYALRDVAGALTAIRDVLNNTPEVTDEVKDEYSAEVAEALGASGTDIEAKAITASTREMQREIAEHESWRRKSNRDLARKGGDFVDGLFAPLGVPYHLALRLEQPMRELARRFPTRLGWLAHWYDATFGPEDREGT